MGTAGVKVVSVSFRVCCEPDGKVKCQEAKAWHGQTTHSCVPGPQSRVLDWSTEKLPGASFLQPLTTPLVSTVARGFALLKWCPFVMD